MIDEIDRISSLSNEEFIQIVAHYNHLAWGKPDSELESRGYSPEALKELDEKKRTSFSPLTSQGLRFTRPISDIEFELLGYTLVLFENYERGVLPFPGSVSEQPSQVMDIFNLLQSLKIERETKLRKQSERNVGNKNYSKPRTR